MSSDHTTPEPDADATTPATDLDPAKLKDALGRTGRMLKTAGLPFEEDEFDDGDGDGASARDGAGAADANRSSGDADASDE